MWLIPPNADASSSSKPDMFIKVPMQPRNEVRKERKKAFIVAKFIRVRKEDHVIMFRNDLLKEEWKGLYVEDINAA